MYSKEIYLDYLIDRWSFDGYVGDFTVIGVHNGIDSNGKSILVCKIQSVFSPDIKSINIDQSIFDEWLIKKRDKKINEILYGT